MQGNGVVAVFIDGDKAVFGLGGGGAGWVECDGVDGCGWVSFGGVGQGDIAIWSTPWLA